MFEEIFKRKQLNPKKLTDFGFVKNGDSYFYETEIMDKIFILCVNITENGAIDTDLTEKENGEKYVLYKTNVTGSFVGEVRNEVENVLRTISAECFETAVFKSDQTKRIIRFAKEMYGDEPEFLWEKSPDNAILRRKDNEKWYGVILTVSKKKLGLNSDEIVEILDLRLQPELMENLLSLEHFYPGWHMNKKHWYTVILDGTLSDEEICERIRTSYELTVK